MLKVENFKSSWRARFSPFHFKGEIPAHLKFSGPNARLSYTCEMNAKFLKLRWNTFGDIGFLMVQFTGWKWEISNLANGPSFQLVIAKLNYLLTCKLSVQMNTFKTFEMKQSFLWKSVKYLWRYRIFAGTAYKLKVGKFQIFSMG